jgi:diacylglycerol O-acyltransferase
MMGNAMREVYPFVPLSPQGHALSLGVLSYDGSVYFGLAGDRDLLPDLDELSAAIGEAIDEQVAAAKPKPKRKRKAKKKPARGGRRPVRRGGRARRG